LARRPAARLLALGGSALLLEAASAGGAGRPGRTAPAGHGEGGGDLLSQALQRDLAVARLTAGVLADGGDDRADALQQPGPLRLVERRRRLDVEDRLHSRGGDVGVLAARPRGAARAQLDLR